MPKKAAAVLQDSFARAIRDIDDHRGLADVSPALLAVLASASRCQWATYWKVDAKAQRLHPAAIWHEENIAAELLHRDTVRRQLSISEGTAGHIWRSRKPVWTTNVILDMCLPRSLEAVSADLHAGIWFALKTNTAVYGVVEMLGRNLEPAGEEILLVVEQLGVLLGRLIETAHLRSLAR